MRMERSGSEATAQRPGPGKMCGVILHISLTDETRTTFQDVKTGVGKAT